MPKFTVLVTLLAVLFYFWFGFRVGRARVKFGRSGASDERIEREKYHHARLRPFLS